jgi:hypothetical protein
MQVGVLVFAVTKHGYCAAWAFLVLSSSECRNLFQQTISADDVSQPSIKRLVSEQSLGVFVLPNIKIKAWIVSSVP